jgi:hypothetical protein
VAGGWSLEIGGESAE